jgi:hypothetical protein
MNALSGVAANSPSTMTTRTRARKGTASQALCSSLNVTLPDRRVVFSDTMSASPSLASSPARNSRWE